MTEKSAAAALAPGGAEELPLGEFLEWSEDKEEAREADEEIGEALGKRWTYPAHSGSTSIEVGVFCKEKICN